MKLEEIKLSRIKNFLRWYEETKEEIPFNKKALWRVQKECIASDLEVYWHPSDSLGKDQIENIIENGLEGWNEVYNELWELNHDYMMNIKDEFIENISIDADDLTETFIQSMMDLYDCDRGDVPELATDEIREFIREEFEEDLHVDIDLDELIRRTNGEIYCDFEDVCSYDLVSLDKVKKTPGDWMYFSVYNLNTNEEIDKMNEYHEDTVGVAHQSHLEDAAYFSVPVMSSLSEYVEFLEKNQDQECPIFAVNLTLKDGTTKTLRTDTMGGDFYLSDQGNYVEPDDDTNVVKSYEIVDASENIEDSKFYANLTEFMTEVNEIVEEYMVEYMRSQIEAKNFTAKDKSGRTLFHYALVLGRMDEFVQVFDGVWSDHAQRHLIHEEDSFAVTPFELCREIAEGEVVAEFVHRVYGLIISNLPRKYETASLWSTSARLMGEHSGDIYYVVESGEEDEQDYDEVKLRSYTGCIEKSSGHYKLLRIKDFHSLVPIQDVEVSLDGRVVA